jgi:molybdopterin-containing oxidoreductase family iron-sulfur binding subunit
MNAILGNPKVEGPELVQETFRLTKPPGEFNSAWSKFLHDGFAAHVPVRDHAGNGDAGAAGTLAQRLWATAAAPSEESPEVVFVRSYSIDDGRYSNNGWLQEMPDPITKLTWDNAAAISPKFARHRTRDCRAYFSGPCRFLDYNSNGLRAKDARV